MLDYRAGAGKLTISRDAATVACTEVDGLKQTGGGTPQDQLLGARQLTMTRCVCGCTSQCLYLPGYVAQMDVSKYDEPRILS